MAPLTRQASRCKKRRRESVRFEGTMRKSAPGPEAVTVKAPGFAGLHALKAVRHFISQLGQFEPQRHKRCDRLLFNFLGLKARSPRCDRL